MAALGLGAYASSDSEDEAPAPAPDPPTLQAAPQAPAASLDFGARLPIVSRKTARRALPLFRKPVAPAIDSEDDDDEVRVHCAPARSPAPSASPTAPGCAGPGGAQAA